jgi:hypothetical protein
MSLGLEAMGRFPVFNNVHIEKPFHDWENRNINISVQVWIQGGGAAPGAPPPLSLEKNLIFWRRIVMFHTKYPTNFRASLRNWKKYDFLA